MRSKIFWKFCAAYFLVISLCLGVSYFFLRSYLTSAITAQTARHLDQVLILVKDSVEMGSAPRWDMETVDPLVDRLSKGLKSRITVINPQGVVVGDSDVSGKELAALENHLRRPEVEQALREGYGQSTRYSSTVKMPMMYVARPFEHGILRVSIPLSGLYESLARIERLLGLGLLLGSLVAFLMSFWLARRFAKPLGEMTGAVLQMAEGNLRVRVPVKGNDEITVLSRSFNHLSEKMDDLVKRISEEKKQLRVILDSMVEGVMVLDSSGQIILTNHAVGEIFSLQIRPEGLTPLELIRNGDLQQVVKEALSGKDSIEKEIQIEKGGSKQIMVHASPLKSEEGTEGSVLVFYDVTNVRRLENMRKEFVANVSHELKTPLAAIKGYSETLLHGALRDEKNALKFLQVIDHHADRLTQLIQDLLDLSKIESAQYELRLERAAIDPLVEELRSTFAQRLEEKRIVFETVSPPGDTLWVDVTALRQILSNLLDNAIKYSNPGGKISLSVQKKDGALTFCVEDNGPGIPPEHLSRVFERFYRVDQSRSRQLGGTGLGLSIVKHLVQLHGGETWAESELGKGSRFYFSLPQKGTL
ncbi:MAG: ATP-binding protein [bacterium]